VSQRTGQAYQKERRYYSCFGGRKKANLSLGKGREGNENVLSSGLQRVLGKTRGVWQFLKTDSQAIQREASEESIERKTDIRLGGRAEGSTLAHQGEGRRKGTQIIL